MNQTLKETHHFWCPICLALLLDGQQVFVDALDGLLCCPLGLFVTCSHSGREEVCSNRLRKYIIKKIVGRGIYAFLG